MAQVKKVIEQVPGWIKLFDDGSVDRTFTGPPEAKFMTEPVPPHSHFIDAVAVTDTTTTTNPALKLRLYLPEKQDTDPEKLPILLHFHGGWFCVSEADWFMYYAVCTRLARESRAIVVSLYLPQAPERRLPAACDDGFAALLWLRSAAGGGGGGHPWLDDHADFDRVFLIGDSSGGNIVHEVAARAGKEEMKPLRVAGGIPIHTDFCRSRRSKSELEQPETPFLTLDMMDEFLSLALPVGATKDHPITCPMGKAAPALEELALPPYLYCVADHDLIKDTEIEFYEGMKRANKDVELLMNNGVGHSFYLNKTKVDNDPIVAEQTRKLFQGIKEFINNH